MILWQQAQNDGFCNYKNNAIAVPCDYSTLINSLVYGNDESKVMKEVIGEYRKNNIPAYVILTTDGALEVRMK